MDSDYDPRERRLNPEIRELLASIDECWSDVFAEDDYLTRKGRLRILGGLVDRLIE